MTDRQTDRQTDRRWQRRAKHSAFARKNSHSNFTKSLTVDDFRGISISLVISKVFEKCVLSRYEMFFTSSDNQFGFKRGLGCSQALLNLLSMNILLLGLQ